MSTLKRGKNYYLRIRPFGELINVRTSALNKNEARQMEMAVLTACRSSDYRSIGPEAREVCVRMFRNQGWEIPTDLVVQELVRPELTLSRAIELFLDYPGVKDSPTKDRYCYALAHIVRFFGSDVSINRIWVPEIRAFQAKRLAEGAKQGTINWETSTLSRLFGVLIELQLVENNPVRLVKKLSRKASERQVYIGHHDFFRIVERCPRWFQRIAWTAYFTGMRRGEVVELTRTQMKLNRRMILLGPADTKERDWKRVPVCRALVPILEEAIKVSSLDTDKVFLIQDRLGVRAPSMEAVKNPWPRACEALQLEKPWPRFHDLRHTWKTNARRSGMDPEIRESILGHWYKEKSVTERYGRISDQELLRAVDSMTFDHGETEIWIAGQ